MKMTRSIPLPFASSSRIAWYTAEWVLTGVSGFMKLILMKILVTSRLNQDKHHVSPFDSGSQQFGVSVDRVFDVPHGVQVDGRIVLLIDKRQGQGAKGRKWSSSLVMTCSHRLLLLCLRNMTSGNHAIMFDTTSLTGWL